MIFTSESGLTDPSRLGEWDAWYLGHLAAMVAVPGITSAQRFRALDDGAPPSLAMYTVASAAVFESEVYLRTRGMGPFVSVVDERMHRRNLFDGLDVAPQVPIGAVLLVADRSEAPAHSDAIAWLRAVALDRSAPYRGIAAFADLVRAREVASRFPGSTALYTPMTEVFLAARQG
ncbi:MAG TPA: hypothetical protein VGQ90_12485 [Stellaceae bacterium]|jgi:hypothetical protein|nr:hypothetical protein [Stellaceae bacterium]